MAPFAGLVYTYLAYLLDCALEAQGLVSRAMIYVEDCLSNLNNLSCGVQLVVVHNRDRRECIRKHLLPVCNRKAFGIQGHSYSFPNGHHYTRWVVGGCSASSSRETDGAPHS